MLTEVQVLRMHVPHGDAVSHEMRVNRAVALLGKNPSGRRVFVAGKEIDGVIPVTTPRWLDRSRIVAGDCGHSAKAWNPVQFSEDFDEGIVL